MERANGVVAHRPVFKTAEDEAIYLDAYDAALSKLWPVPYERVLVESRFGSTHVLVSGPVGGSPLVLLHGSMGTLLMWAPNVEALSSAHRVYAIDIMGQPSRSIPDEPIRSIDEFNEWLSTTLDDLHVDSFDLVGMSYGGWLALNYAIANPERIGKLALLSPVGSFVPMVKQFLFRAILTLLPPRRYWFWSYVKWMGLEERRAEAIGPINELVWLGQRHFRQPRETARIMVTVLSDAELQTLKVPMLLLIGENEVIFDPQKATERARETIPNLEAELLPGAGHELSFSQAPIVNQRLLDYLSQA